MAKTQIKLPPRKWYSLQQAADKLTREFNEPITIEDLLHYSEIELLALSVFISRYRNETVIGNLRFSKEEQDLNIDDSIFEIFGNPNASLSIDHILFIGKEMNGEFGDKKTIPSLEPIDDEPMPKFPPIEDFVEVEGFMNIWGNIDTSPNEIQGLLSYGILLKSLNLFASPYNESNERYVIQFMVKSSKDIYLKIDNLYILESDLNNFIKGKKTPSINEIIKEQSNISPRKQGNQLDFIRALLKTHYGTDDPNECRKLLDSGKIAKDFARAQVAPNITPETLRNWLKTEK